MSEDELKAKYARLLLKINDPFKAALQLFPDNTARALRVANEWPNDPDVIAAESKLLEDDGEMSFLPSKVDFARQLWYRMQEERLLPEDYVKLGKLYADVRGFIEKPQTTINNNNVTNNRVMLVKDHGTNAEWEDKLRKQQADLTNATKH